MSGRHANHARRARLVERAAEERDELGDGVAPWRKPIAAVDQGLAILRALKRAAPILAAGIGAGIAALSFVRPAGIAEWWQRGQALWRAVAEGTRGEALPPAARGEPSGEAVSE